jgi:hypothetical protein
MATLPTLRKGSQGASVEYLQQRLNAKGYQLKADGDFGSSTDKAVRQFQAGQGLMVDGVVGGRTWTALQVEGVAKTPEELLQQMRSELASKVPSGAPAVVKKVLALACADLGKKENPYGYNDGPDIHHLVKHYNQYWWVLKEGVDLKAIKVRGYPLETECVPPMAWCAMAVANWIRLGLGLPDWNYQAGVGTPLLGHPFQTFLGGASQIESWAKGKGQWNAAKASSPMPAGAAFTISRGKSGSDPSSSPKAGHIGMCVCDNGDGTITTIEGNVSNGVGSYTRKKTDLRGYATWW